MAFQCLNYAVYIQDESIKSRKFHGEGYCELELNLRIKPKKRIKGNVPEALIVPESINQVWSMDFMPD